MQGSWFLVGLSNSLSQDLSVCFRAVNSVVVSDRRWPVGDPSPRPALPHHTSVCSAISSASSTSIPRYRTVLSSLEWPSSNCTARRFLVRLYISVAFVRRSVCVP